MENSNTSEKYILKYTSCVYYFTFKDIVIFTKYRLLLQLLQKLLQLCLTVWPQRRQPTRLPCPKDSPGKKTGVGYHFLLQCMKLKSESEVAQSWLTGYALKKTNLLKKNLHHIMHIAHNLSKYWINKWVYLFNTTPEICFYFTIKWRK